MKTKIILPAFLLFLVKMGTAQITPSMTIPNPLPNYDGTYDNFGQNHLFYPNDGEVRYANTDQTNAKSVVKYYTMNTYPKKYLLRDNKMAYVHYKPKGLTGSDSLQRIDIGWFGGTSGAAWARVDTQNFAKLHYFTEWFGSGGRTDVMGGAAIALQSIYPNIDLVYTSNNAGLVIYFIVYPGGNYKNIVMEVTGAKSTAVSSNKLKIDANWESSSFEKPEMYQYTYVSNVVTPVPLANATWVSIGSNKYEFNTTSSYSGSLPLIIQVKQANAVAIDTPGLEWSTYFGGTQSEWLNRTHSDASNNLYVGGYSQSQGFPQNPGLPVPSPQAGDAALVKFDSFGVIQSSTFVGGSGQDEFYDFDFSGNNIYCVGHTSTSNLNTVSKVGATNDASFDGPSWDALICQLSFATPQSAPTLDWLTYFGGNGDDELNACKFDSQGNFYAVGASASSNMTATGCNTCYVQSFNAAQLPGTPLSTDGIIAKFNSSSLINWFTFYGTDQLGTNAHTSAADYLYGLTISGSDLYVCGKAGGTNLPTGLNSKSNSGNFDGILAHFSTSGSLMTNSARYTNGNISNYSVKTWAGDVYTVGQAAGSMNTINSGSQYFNGTSSGATDACFSIHDQSLGTIIHNTYLGGDDNDAAYDIKFTSNNLFYIAGGTSSTNFPTNNALTNMFNSNGGPDPQNGIWTNDNFVACFQPGNTNLKWSTYLGSNDFHESLGFPNGMDSQQPRAITTIALDGLNRLHLVGYTNSNTTFPKDDGAGVPYFSANKNGFIANDATITRFNVIDINAVVGLSDFENTEFVFGIYPNPTSKTLSILNSEISSQDLRYAIYDMNGKKLTEGTFLANEPKNIDISTLVQGVYIINVSNGTKTFSNKFVKVSK